MAPHPLAPLSREEFEKARDLVVKLHSPESNLFFRCIYLQEPKKEHLITYLQAEHGEGVTGETECPPRLAMVQYDLVKPDNKRPEYTQSIVNLDLDTEVERKIASPKDQTSYSPDEFAVFQDACVKSRLFQDAIAEFELPEQFTVLIDPWPYGGLEADEDVPRLMQGLVFAQDGSSGNPDSNHYGFPIPIIPVMDFTTRELIRIDRLATGGAEGGLEVAPRGTKPKPMFRHTKPAEYIPELLDRPLRTDLKPINITQPEGASFNVYPDNLVEWQKWRFRLGFTPREGPVIHDLCYDNRPVFFRLSYSELTVPYSDARPPFQRKQAFDVGDGGFGRAANNLELGCDCVGAIHYFDTLLSDPEGNPTLGKAVVCLHEQDNGIGWKHTNFRTNRAAITRLRELVVQCIVTLANYEYILAFKFDVAGGVTVETRATGIMSVVAIDEGKHSDYGNVVAPGILAQNHQHIFAVRIDPAMDSYADGGTRIVVEESVPAPATPETNPYGNYYQVKKNVLKRASWVDAEPKLNRVIRLENSSKENEVSGRNVGFKLTPPATQLLLADNDSPQARRARFAQHSIWVTGYRDGELWAAGEFTNQSVKETGGVHDMVKRGDWFIDGTGEAGGQDDATGRLSSPVLWAVFGLTHNPRVEDWPVMPVEIHHINIRPADFFTLNPALDVPGTKNTASVVVPCCGEPGGEPESVQRDQVTHLQGTNVEAAWTGAPKSEKQNSTKRLSKMLGDMFSLKGNKAENGE